MKKYLILVLIVLVMSALIIGVPAAKEGKVPHGPAGGSNIAHAYLYEKDSIWDIVPEGAWGKMKYNQEGSTFDFVFNGHGLVEGEDYTLIYYPDKTDNPWPREEIICLGSGIANAELDVHIMGSVDTGTDLPAVWDDAEYDGAKIWLVLSADIDCDDRVMSGWNPTEYLFEYDVINFAYTGD
ncbi:hypothetical protein ES705_34016 [subsurface metagenome]